MKKKIFYLLIFNVLPLFLFAQGEVNPTTGYPYTWDELRAMDEFDYESRWDDLNLLRRPYWVTKEEVESKLGIANVEFNDRKEDNSLQYLVGKGGNKLPLLSIKHIIFGDIEKVKAEENGILSDIRSTGNRFYEQIPLEGVSDLRAYWRKDRGWIYVFPEKGMSYFFINYYKSNKETVEYLKNKDTPDPKADFAKEYLHFFVKKFDGKLRE